MKINAQLICSVRTFIVIRVLAAHAHMHMHGFEKLHMILYTCGHCMCAAFIKVVSVHEYIAFAGH